MFLEHAVNCIGSSNVQIIQRPAIEMSEGGYTEIESPHLNDKKKIQILLHKLGPVTVPFVGDKKSRTQNPSSMHF
ncbi:hypothetical protein RJ641_014438, partial [Dillenia turbinata]